MKKLLLFMGGMILVFLVVLYMLYSSKLLIPPKISFLDRGLKTAPAEEVNHEDPQHERIRETIDYAVRMLETEFKNADIRYRYENGDRFCFFNIYDPAYTGALAEAAENGDRDSETKWDNLVKQVRILQRRIQEKLLDIDDDTTAVVNIVDPKEPDTVLLTVAHGIAGYDIVNGIDLKTLYKAFGASEDSDADDEAIAEVIGAVLTPDANDSDSELEDTA